MLQYIAHTDMEHATYERLQIIQRMVDDLKKEEEVSNQYMKILEQEELIREEATEEIITNIPVSYNRNLYIKKNEIWLKDFSCHAIL